MSFIKKIWKDRISEYPTRRNLEKSDGSSELVTVSRSEGNISQEGDAFSAENMNDLEERISNEFEALNTNTEILTGTLGEQNVTTYLSFPDGYNSTNCMIISIMAYVDSNYVGNAINFNWVYVNLESSRIAIVSRDASVVGKTFKLLLQKTK